jgi:hypothetical protein
MLVPSPGFAWAKDAIRPANPVVDHRELPIRPRGIVFDGYARIALAGWECVLERVHDKLGDDQAEARRDRQRRLDRGRLPSVSLDRLTNCPSGWSKSMEANSPSFRKAESPTTAASPAANA